MFFKTISLSSLLLLSFCLNAQEIYSDRWKEIKRTDRQDKPVVFNDTMHLSNVTKTSLKMRRGSFEYPGIISNDLLEVGEDQYQVIKQHETEISIGDQDYIHIFARQLKDQSAADATLSLIDRTLPQKPVNSIDPALLTGKWEAYNRKRKDGQPGKINYKTLIKSITFHTAIQDNSYGSISTQNGTVKAIKALKGSDIIIMDADEKKEHPIIVRKLTKEELIIEDEDGILYYLKQF